MYVLYYCRRKRLPSRRPQQEAKRSKLDTNSDTSNPKTSSSDKSLNTSDEAKLDTSDEVKPDEAKLNTSDEMTASQRDFFVNVIQDSQPFGKVLLIWTMNEQCFFSWHCVRLIISFSVITYTVFNVCHSLSHLHNLCVLTSQNVAYQIYFLPACTSQNSLIDSYECVCSDYKENSVYIWCNALFKRGYM